MGEAEILTRLLTDDSENVILTHDEIILTVQLNIGTAIFGKENTITLFDLHGDTITLVIGLARTNSHYLALCRFLLCTVRNNDPTCSFFLFLQSFDKKTII